MVKNCSLCKKEYSPLCDWQQGRCPLHPAIINSHSMRFIKFLNFIKKLLKNEKKL